MNVAGVGYSIRHVISSDIQSQTLSTAAGCMDLSVGFRLAAQRCQSFRLFAATLHIGVRWLDFLQGLRWPLHFSFLCLVLIPTTDSVQRTPLSA